MLAQSEHVAHWIEDAGFSVETPPRLLSAGTTWLCPSAGWNSLESGWAAIGDAAAAFDPLSSHGMTSALWTAGRMPEVVLGALNGDQGPLARYASAVDSGVDRFLAERTAIYESETRFRDRPFWSRRRSSLGTTGDDTQITGPETFVKSRQTLRGI